MLYPILYLLYFVYSAKVDILNAGSPCSLDDECKGVSMCIFTLSAGDRLCTCIKGYAGDECKTIQEKSVLRHRECIKDKDCAGTSLCAYGSASRKINAGIRKVHGVCVCKLGFGGDKCSEEPIAGPKGTMCFSHDGCSEEMLCSEEPVGQCECAGRLVTDTCKRYDINDSPKRGEICTTYSNPCGPWENAFCGYPSVATFTTFNRICLCEKGRYGEKCELKIKINRGQKCQFNSDCAGASTCAEATGVCACAKGFEGLKCDVLSEGAVLSVDDLCDVDENCPAALKCQPSASWEGYDIGEGVEYTCQYPFGTEI